MGSVAELLNVISWVLNAEMQCPSAVIWVLNEISKVHQMSLEIGVFTPPL
jgi:hypothetical protein